MKYVPFWVETLPQVVKCPVTKGQYELKNFLLNEKMFSYGSDHFIRAELTRGKQMICRAKIQWRNNSLDIQKEELFVETLMEQL